MNLRICICCGEGMSAAGRALSRNPNVCASCSSLLDEMEDSGQYSRQQSAPPGSLKSKPAPATGLAPAAFTIGPERVLEDMQDFSTCGEQAVRL